MEAINKKILLVEDDPNFGIVLKDYLSMNDFDERMEWKVLRNSRKTTMMSVFLM